MKILQNEITGTQTSFFHQFVFKIPEAGSSSSSSSLKNQDTSLGLVWFGSDSFFEKIEPSVPVPNSGPKIIPSSSLVFY